jgi:hypothetical protein
MKTSKALKHAKEYLAKNYAEVDSAEKDQFICWAVSEAQRRRFITDRTEANIKRIIQDRLNAGKVRCTTLETWLSVNHGIEHPHYDASENAKRRYVNKIQRTRHAWIDSLIAEFAAKGD